jgi:CBS domain-containing protein
MANQSLQLRIYEALKQFMPFEMIQKEDLLALAKHVSVQYYNENDHIFKQGDPLHGHFFFIKEGSIKLLRVDDNQTQLKNECDEGECFGLTPLFLDEPYLFTAIVVEEALIYAIPIGMMQQLLEKYPKVSLFLAAALSLNIRNTYSNKISIGKELNEYDDINLGDIVTLDNLRAAKTCNPNDTLLKVTKLMSKYAVSSIIIVDSNQLPLGILSDSTIRKSIANGTFDIDAKVREIMTKPPACTSPGLTLADIQIQMIKNKVRYLCVTDDGTPGTPLLGIISEHDLIIAHGNNPAVILREIQYAQNVAELKALMVKVDVLLANYLRREMTITYVANIISELNDALIKKTIEFASLELIVEEIPIPDVHFCFLVLGSAGRREQLIKTDQDNAIIIENCDDNQLIIAKKYYLELGKKVTYMLHQVGFAYCKGNMMASNPAWCITLDEWKAQFDEWISYPTSESLLKCKIFFDIRPIEGNHTYCDALIQHIFDKIEKQPIFLTFMANNAISNPPPLSFFRNFIVEKNGEHEDLFNIKTRALVPITDSVRTLVLGKHIAGALNTIQRLKILADGDPNNEKTYNDLADSFEVFMKFKAQEGLKNHSSGKFIKIDELTKLDRLILRQSFNPISEVQKLLSIRFNTASLK